MTIPGGSTNTHESWDPMLERLYRDHYDDLVACANKMLGERMLAEEVVQEAFLRFHTTNARPRPGRELSYLRSIALNGGRALIRRQKMAEAKQLSQPIPATSVEAHCLRSESITLLTSELKKLPRRQREVILLRYCADMSETETAELLDIGNGSVKTHAWRGRAALRDALSDRLAS